tara:strand:- start:1559 stop:1855 length:297 start_codon:yes stop_codon:yes gene_type:complete
MNNKKILIDLLYFHKNSKLNINTSFYKKPGITIKDFFKHKDVADTIKNIPISDYKFGIFGDIVDDSYVLQDNDRLEIYNPITITSKERRKLISKIKRK